jgi:hypothetical protein
VDGNKLFTPEEGRALLNAAGAGLEPGDPFEEPEPDPADPAEQTEPPEPVAPAPAEEVVTTDA